MSIHIHGVRVAQSANSRYRDSPCEHADRQHPLHAQPPKKNGISSMKTTSDTWPSVIVLAALVTPTSFRKTFAQLK